MDSRREVAEVAARDVGGPVTLADQFGMHAGGLQRPEDGRGVRRHVDRPVGGDAEALGGSPLSQDSRAGTHWGLGA